MERRLAGRGRHGGALRGGQVRAGGLLGRGAVGSAYGAAGSLAIVLLWVYYSAQILLFGAEITQAYATQRGSWVEPKEKAAPAAAPPPPRWPRFGTRLRRLEPEVWWHRPGDPRSSAAAGRVFGF